MPFDIARSLANDFHKEINELYTDIKLYQQSISDEFIRNGSITNSGGVVRFPENEDLTNKGIVNRGFANRVGLSHIIQGEGAKIARDIVTASKNLRFSNLHIPIHDGFVFYTDTDVDLAVIEATELMRECSGIDIPVKMEWSRSNNMLNYM
jgi:DNA polymerase I-like protein with 3'-5' exonuclease and polymerase domains